MSHAKDNTTTEPTATTASNRKRKLKEIHYETATIIGQLINDTYPVKTQVQDRKTIRRFITQLANEAGLPKEGRTDLGFKEIYLASIRSLYAKFDADYSPSSRALQRLAAKYENLRLAPKPNTTTAGDAPTCPKCAGVEKRARKSWTLEDESWGTNGDGKERLQKGDHVTIEKMPVEEVRLGDYLMLENPKSWSPGIVTFIDETVIHVKSYCGSTYKQKLADVTIWRLISIRHTTIIERASDAQTKTERQIKELRRRIENLDGDITDCTQRFKLERQLYDLQREATFDEWPDLINV